MSNIFPAQSPAPFLPDFIRSFVLELDAMHREGKLHGGINGEPKEWLTTDTAAFDPIKFRASAIASPMNGTGTAADVAAFQVCARRLISGTSAKDDLEFIAAHYSHEKLPMPFLRLLEKSDAVDSKPINMSDFLEALKEDPLVLPGPTPPALTPSTIAEQPKPSYVPVPIPDKFSIRIALPNGTVGKPYQIEPGKIAKAIAAQRNEDPERAKIVHLQLPDDCGLVFDVNTGIVSGVPTRSLEQQLHLDYTPSSSSPSISCKASLFINPDPASLWKDLPSNPNEPYQKESLDHKEYIFGDFRIVAASRRGRSHANRGDFRDDDFAVGHADTTGWLVVAVADGAGSAKYSRQGSRIAATVARDWLVSTLDSPEYSSLENSVAKENPTQSAKPKRAIRDLLYDAARLAHYKIKEESENPSELLPEPPVIRNYDTTLILVLMKKIKAGYFAASFSVGDGGAGILMEPESAIPLTHADGGEHAGQTTFVTIASSLTDKEENLGSRYRQTIESDFAAILAMTDGITDPKFPSDAAFADPKSWHALWDEIKPTIHDSSALLEWMNFFSPGNHDDRTLVVVTPKIDPEKA